MGEEQDIFDASLEDERDLPAPEGAKERPADPEAPASAAPEPRDEAQPQQEGQEPAAASDAAPKPQDKPQDKPQEPAPQHQVPLSELLNTRERAQRAEQERDQFRQALEAIQRQQHEAQRQPQDPPDVFADPKAYTEHLTRTFDQRLAAIQLENNLQLAEVRHGEAFGKAYDAFLREVGQGQNPALYHQVMQSRNPGESMVGWYKNQEVLREVGPDPVAYKAKLQQQLLDDPAFLAQAVEKVRGAGQAAPNVRPQTVTRLPPSLSRVASAAPAAEGDEDGSEEAIFSAGNPSRRRR